MATQHLEHSGVSWKGQQLGHKHSRVDTLDPRLRIIFTMIFAVVTVFSQSFPSLLAALSFALLSALFARLDYKRTVRRVVAMDLFIIFMLILLPFTTPGDALINIGPLQATQQGLLLALAIGLKANAIILMTLALTGTLNATTFGHALSKLKIPDKFVYLLLFTVRYLEVINREYKKMRNAMKARAFTARSNLHTWRTLGYLFGMLLVRSLERSERILAAMKCRGYTGKLHLVSTMKIQRQDYLFTIIALNLSAVIIGLHFL